LTGFTVSDWNCLNGIDAAVDPRVMEVGCDWAVYFIKQFFLFPLNNESKRKAHDGRAIVRFVFSRKELYYG
jgi:hypothetical protein